MGLEAATIWLIVSITLSVASIAAALLLQPDAAKTDSPAPAGNSAKPTYVKRGAFLHYVLGDRQVGPFVCFVGDEESEMVDANSAGGSGGGSADTPSPEVEVFEQPGWHVLALGPGKELTAIYADNEIIFNGPITPSTHESGSILDIGNDGTFQIFWGEKNQPIHSYLTDRIFPGREIASRWPFAFGVLWRPKKKGTRQQWASLEYRFKVGPYNSLLTKSAPWVHGIVKETANSFNIQGHTNGPPGVASWLLNGNKKKYFKAGGLCKVLGNSADGTYEVLNSVYNKGPDTTLVILNDTLSGANNNGQLIQMKETKGSGVNPAHALSHMLFNRWPHGLAIDPSLFDLESLEAAGILFEEEGSACSIHGKDGQDFFALISNLCSDFSIMISLVDGIYKVIPIRAPASETIPHLSEDVVMLPIPERGGALDSSKEIGRVVFEYSNMKRRGKDATVQVDNDGNASIFERKRQERVRLETVVHHVVASQVANRRTPEVIVKNSTVKVNANRGASRIYPGRAFTMATVEHVLRCLSIQPGMLTGKVQIEAVIDTHGVTPTTFEDQEEDYPDLPGGEPPEADLKALFMESRPEFRAPRFPSIIPLRIRRNKQTRGVTQYISPDGSSFRNIGFTHAYHFGGPLLDPLPANSYTLLEEGPRFTISGPDIARVLDLSSDHTSWLAGRQLAIFARADGEVEVAFLRNITVLSETEARLDGLVRGRFGDRKLDLSTGVDWVIITTRDNMRPINDYHMLPGATVWMKFPTRTQESMPLADADAIEMTLRGRGVVPEDTSIPWFTAPHKLSPCFVTGGGFSAKVMYHTAGYPGTGAGMQPAGFPFGDAPVRGKFVWRFRQMDDTLVHEEVTSEPEIDVVNADLVAWFTSEPSSFRLGVAAADAGYYSNERTIDVQRI